MGELGMGAGKLRSELGFQINKLKGDTPISGQNSFQTTDVNCTKYPLVIEDCHSIMSMKIIVSV